MLLGTLCYSFALMAEAMRVDLGWSKTDIYGAATLGRSHKSAVASSRRQSCIQIGEDTFPGLAMDVRSILVVKTAMAESECASVISRRAGFAYSPLRLPGQGTWAMNAVASASFCRLSDP
jgi:hypothetical protein